MYILFHHGNYAQEISGSLGHLIHFQSNKMQFLGKAIVNMALD